MMKITFIFIFFIDLGINILLFFFFWPPPTQFLKNLSRKTDNKKMLA